MIKFTRETMPIRHGGNLHHAIHYYNIERDYWLDMSTGISPWSWPVDELPEKVWQALPPPTTVLLQSASHYYGCDIQNIIATPGTQLTIRFLPHLFNNSSVAIPDIGYQEHRLSWQLAGHKIVTYRDYQQLNELIDSKAVEHVVVINPNNPSGSFYNDQQIQQLVSKISGTLIVDEAYIDCLKSELTSAIHTQAENVIVLRSIGKFFGLAGLRLGFIIGKHPALKQLEVLLNPWSISYASQFIATKVLNDRRWQSLQESRIAQSQAHVLGNIKKLADQFLADYQIINGGLFVTVFAKKQAIKALHHMLARHAIWTRLHDENSNIGWLRFSLASESDQHKFDVITSVILNPASDD